MCSGTKSVPRGWSAGGAGGGVRMSRYVSVWGKIDEGDGECIFVAIAVDGIMQRTQLGLYYARGDTSPIVKGFPDIRLVHSGSRRHSVYKRLGCGVKHVIKVKVDVKALGEREGKNVANI